MRFFLSREYSREYIEPALGSMWNFLWRYLIASYPLMGWLFFRCLRIMMSMKFWIILRLRVDVVLASKVNTESEGIYVLEYNPMCL